MIGITVLTSFTQLAAGQTLNHSSATYTSFEIERSSTQPYDTAVEVKPAILNEISTRAVRGFMQNFKNIDNESWSKYEKGFVASFRKDSVDTRVYYNLRGDFEVTIRYFFENRLSPQIRRIVKSTYYDYNIFQVSEVSNNFGKIYYIKIGDGIAWKLIRIVNGEMEAIQEYSENGKR